MKDKTGKDVVVQHLPENNAYAIAYEAESDAAGVSYYVDNGDERIFYHTEVKQELGGRGLGSILVSEAMAAEERSGRTVVASCPMIRAWLHKHDEWEGKWREPRRTDMLVLQQKLG